jgi:3-oxoacyl-[acyl-carrier-protein] synthase II
MGEGCALFLLETEESAQKRGATILAEIVGVGSTFDPDAAFGDTVNGDCTAEAIKNACNQAGISPDSIDFIASSASGNRRSDSMESLGIKSVFGTKTPVTAYKIMTGECYGASGAINMMCALSDLKNKQISGCGAPYPTLNDMPLVFNTIKKECSYALVTSVSCDGNCSAVIIKNVN